MGKRSAEEILDEEGFLNLMLLSNEEVDSALQPHEKAEKYIGMGFTQKAVCTAIGISKQALSRARNRASVGEPVGQKGRPPYLSSGMESELERWIIAENQAGRGPPIYAVQEKVRPVFLIKNDYFYQFYP